MKQVLDDGETHFQQLTLTLSDYNKGKIGVSEILINDRLFDVKSYSITGNTVQLLVVNDTQEEGIVERVSVIVKQL